MRDWFVAIALLILLVLLTTGCATMGSIARVLIPVSTSCVVQIGDPGHMSFPDSPDAITSAPNIEARVNLILAGRLLRDKRIDELEAALSACR